MPADDEPDQELERRQRLPPPPYQEPGVVTLDLEHGPAKVFVVYLGQPRADIDAHHGDEALQNLGGCRHHVRRLLQHGDADAGGLAPDSQDARPAAANDVYFYLASLYVELL